MHYGIHRDQNPFHRRKQTVVDLPLGPIQQCSQRGAVDAHAVQASDFGRAVPVAQHCVVGFMPEFPMP